MEAHWDILDQLTTAVAVLDADADRVFRVAYLNQSAQALFGRSAARAAGRPFAALVADDHASPAALWRVLESGVPFTKRDVALPRAAGAARVSYSIAPLSRTAVVAEFQRLDRFRRIDKNDRHAMLPATLGELARALAHEVKNPLGGIRGAAQLLDRKLDREQREYTAVIVAEADRLRDLVDRMLGPVAAPALAPVSVHHVVEHVLKLAQAQTDQIAFARDYDPSLPAVDGDFGQLVQAALNVVNNAILALRGVAAPTLTVRTRVLRQFTIGATRHRLVANLDFIDNGPGVPPEIAESIFLPMISGRPEGSGLGLAVAQTILGRHHGYLACESEPGRTVFSFYLPVGGKAGAGTSRPRAPAAGQASGERRGG